MAPAAHDPSKRVPTMMTTADMALRERPRVPGDLGEIPQRPRSVQGRLGTGLVQAHPSRHGAQGPLPRPRCAVRGPDLAGPGPGRTHAVGRRRHRVQGQDPGRRVHHRAAGQDRLGIGVDVSPLRPSRRRQRRPHPACAAEGLGGERAGRACRVLAKIDELRGGLSMADAIVLAGTAAVEKAARDAGFNVTVPFAGGRGDATQEMDGRRELRGDGARRRRFPQLPQDQAFGADRGVAARPRVAAGLVRARDDGADRRPSRARCQPRRCAGRRVHHPQGPADQRLLRQPARRRHLLAGGRRQRRRGVHRLRPRRQAGEMAGDPNRPRSSGRTASCARPPRSMRRRAATRSSSATSFAPGPRS